MNKINIRTMADLMEEGDSEASCVYFGKRRMNGFNESQREVITKTNSPCPASHSVQTARHVRRRTAHRSHSLSAKHSALWRRCHRVNVPALLIACRMSRYGQVPRGLANGINGQLHGPHALASQSMSAAKATSPLVSNGITASRQLTDGPWQTITALLPFLPVCLLEPVSFSLCNSHQLFVSLAFPVKVNLSRHKTGPFSLPLDDSFLLLFFIIFIFHTRFISSAYHFCFVTFASWYQPLVSIFTSSFSTHTSHTQTACTPKFC